MLSWRRRTASKGSSAAPAGSGSSGTAETEAWVDVQSRTYTKWLNDKLKSTGHRVSNLFKDLDDGLVLISLLEVLSGKKVGGKIHRKPTKSSHKNHNLAAVLSFLKDEEIPATSISANHILEGNRHQILSLLWVLICHYQITDAGHGPKSLLLDILQACLIEKTISNFTSDWNDGFLLSTLINFCDSSLMIDYKHLDKDDALENIENALQAAEKSFGIPQLLTKEDFIMEKPDERSIMTYLSYYCIGPESPVQKKFLEWIQEQTNDETITDFSDCWVDGKKLGKLVQAVSPGSLEDLQSIEEESGGDTESYCKTIMENADNLLGIDMTVTPTQFVSRSENPVLRLLYLMQFYFSTNQVKVGELHVPKEPGVGATVWLDIVVPADSMDKIHTTVDGKLVGTVPVEVKETDSGHRVQFDAEIQDTYTLDVSVGNMRVKGSPFVINLAPPDPSLVVVTSTSALPKKAGIPIILTLDTEQAGHGEIVAEANGEESGEVPFSVDNTGPYSYKVSFIPMQAEKYTLDIRMDGQHVKGSPFSFDLSTLIHPEAVLIGKPMKGAVGEPVTIPINVGGAGKAKLEVKCLGEKAGEVTVTCNPPANPTEITFIPAVEDVYTVSVFFDGTEVIDSPITINLIPVPPDANNVKLIRPPAQTVKGKDQVRMGFNIAEAGDGLLTATCSGAKVGDVDTNIENVESDEYDVAFTPTDSDEFTINVLWSGDHVPGSPFHMKLKPADYPEPTKCEILNLPDSSQLMLVGEPITFNVDTKNAGKGQLDVMVEVTKIEGKMGDDDQVSMVSTMTRDSDTYSQIMATEEDHELEPIAEEAEIQAGQEKVMHIRVTHREGERKRLDGSEDKEPTRMKRSASELEWVGDMGVDNMLDFEDENTAKLVIDKVDEDPGMYQVTYIPVIDGIHTINVYWSDMPLPSSPMSFKVLKPQIGFYKEAVPVEIHTVYKRKQLKTRIDQRDGTNVKGIRVRMDKVKTGHYFLVFTPPEPGIYLLHVSAKKKYLPSSPYIINYLKPDIPRNLRVGTSNFSDQANVGQPFSFLIKAEDFDDLMDNVAVTRSRPQVDGSPGEELDPVQLESMQDGAVRVTYVPNEAGDESIEVKVGDTFVPGSPFKISVLEEDSGEEGAVSPSLEAAATVVHIEEKKEKHKKKKKDNIISVNLNEQKFTIYTPCKFKVDCRDLGAGELLVLSKPSAAAEITITNTSDSKSHLVEIVPKKVGKCELILRCNGNDIPGSPFALNFLARGSAEKCMLLENSDCSQSQDEEEKMFCVSTKGAGKGKLTAFMKSLSNDKDITVTVEQESKHHHHLKFNPSEGLNYMLTVRFDDVDIAGSPFKILLGNPSFTQVEGNGLTKPWSGRMNTFYVLSENSGPGKLTVYIESDGEDLFSSKGSKVEPNVTQLEEFKYEVTYQPRNPGIYWVSVKWKDVHIPGSPFKAFCLKPLSPDQFSIADHAPFTHQGKPAKFLVVVDKSIHEDDKLTATLYDSDDKEIQGEVTRRNDTSYSMVLQPPELREYTVFVLWDKQHIIGSPFQINNIEPTKPSEVSIEDVREEDGVVSVKVAGPMLSFRYGQLRAYLTVYRSGEDTYVASDVQAEVVSISHSEALVKFPPVAKQKHQLSIWYDSEHIKGSPFELVSTDASHCRSRGLGLKQAQTHQPNRFSVLTENAGHGELKVEIFGQPDNGEDTVYILPEVSLSQDCTRHDVSYVVNHPGQYTIAIKWDDQHIPHSPFEIICCDPSRYKVLSPPQVAILTRPLKFGLVQSSPPPSYEQLSVFLRGQDGVHHAGTISKGNDDGLFCSILPPELGKYIVHVQCNGFEIPGSPFRIQNMPTPVPANVAVSGPGIANGCVGQKGTFEIDVSMAGHSHISLKVQGPKNGFRVDLNQDPTRKRVIIAEYNPIYPGTYSLGVLWDGVHVPSSPFTVTIVDSIQSATATGASGVTMESVRDADN